MKLDALRAAVVVVDAQVRLAAAMPPETVARTVKYVRALLACARELGLPVLASEQYPRGLGPMLAEIRELLPSAPFQKLHFSCADDAAFSAALSASGRRQIVIAGMETHVCVYLTARDLVATGHEVHVCADAVSSRTEEHRRVGLEMCRAAGAIVTTAETSIFDLLGVAKTAAFDRVAPFVK